MTKQNLFRSAAFMFLIGGVSAISAWEEGAQPVGHPGPCPPFRPLPIIAVALAVGVGLSMVAGNPEAEDCP